MPATLTVLCPRCGRESSAAPASAIRCAGCGAFSWAPPSHVEGPARGTPFSLETRPPRAAERLWAVAAPVLLLAAFLSILAAEVAGIVALARWIVG